MKRLSVLLPAGEPVTYAGIAMIRDGAMKQAGMDLAKSVALSALAGGAVSVTSMPPVVWVVVTPGQVLMIEKKTGAGFRHIIGNVAFQAPRQAITATLKSGLVSRVIIADRGNGQSLLTVGYGVRRKSAESMASAIGHAQAG
jgi:hypothetical protein